MTARPARNHGRPDALDKGPQGPFVLSASGVLRVVLVLGGAIIMAVLAIQLARVDAPFGRPYGPDRLVEAIDAAESPEGLPENAATLARRALQDRPIDGRAYRVLGQVAMAADEDAQAGALLEIAAERWPRDRMAQALQAERAFANGDIAAAVTHLDALLRVAPDIRTVMFAQMVGLLEFPEFRAALVARMADPPWRSALVRALRSSDTPAGPALALLDELAASRPLTDDESQARVALLARAGHPAQAREAWLAALAPAARAASGLLFDGGFEHPEIHDGYGWQMRPAAGLVIGADTTAPHTGKYALAVTFNGRAVAFAHLQQALALPAGRYRLRASADNRTGSTRPFVWQLTCDGANQRVAELALPESQGWQMAETDFVIDAACSGQRLVLTHASRSLAERQMRGTLYLDDIEIVPAAIQ